MSYKRKTNRPYKRTRKRNAGWENTHQKVISAFVEIQTREVISPTLREVAEHAGVSVSCVSQHIKSIEGERIDKKIFNRAFNKIAFLNAHYLAASFVYNAIRETSGHHALLFYKHFGLVPSKLFGDTEAQRYTEKMLEDIVSAIYKKNRIE